MKKEFIKFLRDRNALVPFIVNLHIYKGERLNTYLNENISPSSKYNKNLMKWANASLISMVFNWNDTYEGHDYWAKLDFEWFTKIYHYDEKLQN